VSAAGVTAPNSRRALEICDQARYDTGPARNLLLTRRRKVI